MSDPTVTILGFGEVELGVGQLGAPQFRVSERAPTQTGVPYLDPSTGDYAQREGVILGGTSARQMIIILVLTEFGSSLAVRGRKDPEFHDETTEQITRAEVRTCIEPLLIGERPWIRLDGITVQREKDGVVGRLGVRIDYFDYLKNKPDSVEL